MIDDGGDSALSVRAILVVISALVITGAILALTLGGGSEPGPSLSVQREKPRRGPQEIVAYVSGGDVEPGDSIRLTCSDIEGRLVLGVTAPLTDDRGIETPHLHQALPPRALKAITECRARVEGLSLRDRRLT